MSCVIRDLDGNIIQTSRNLRGIRQYVSTNLIKLISIEPLAHFEGKLCILFDNGASFETNFASFDVLKQFVRQWRNVYGAPLRVNHCDCGTVNYRNVELA